MNKWQRNYSLNLNGNFAYLRNRMYSRAKERVGGKRPHPHKEIWLGLSICSKEEFYKWFDSNKQKIKSLWNKYLEGGKKRGLTLSLNRINSEQGYIIGNIEIITQAENSSLRKDVKRRG